MRIAYVVKRYPRYSETFIVNEILAHEQAGLDIQIYALLPPQDSHFQDIISRVKAPVIYLSPKAERASVFWEIIKQVAQIYPSVWQALGRYPSVSAREVLQALELARYVDRFKIDHLHAHFATTSTTVAQLTSAITQVPFTFTAHAKDIFHQDNDFVALREKFSDAKCAVTVSSFNIEYLTGELGIAPAQLRRIYNGIDMSEFPYLSPKKRAPVICAVGRLVEKKGFDDLIDACLILKRKGVDFKCEIIGEGEQKRYLKQKISELGLKEAVKMHGSLPQGEVKTHLYQAAVFAAPCVVGKDGNRDGLPTVLLESMALGTPCVSTPVTGIPEVIIDGETGLMVAESDTEALACALGSLLMNAELRESLALNARELMEREFDIHHNSAKIRQCFLPNQANLIDRDGQQ